MIHKEDFHSQTLLGHPNVAVLYRASFNKRFNPNASLVCFAVNGCKIIMASNHFSADHFRVKRERVYAQLDVSLNCNLKTMAHGSDQDTPATNMPLFEGHADRMHQALTDQPHKTVLVNCAHGRSRTGTAVALYLMKYHGFSAVDAISVVTAVMNFRGIKTNSIDLKVANPHGSYGDWLRAWTPGQYVPVVVAPVRSGSLASGGGLFKRRKFRAVEAGHRYASKHAVEKGKSKLAL